jgi:D-alanine-D-alanine ligase
MQQKKKIAFLTGGYSGEAQISYKSAVQIQANLDTNLFDIFRIDIRRDGWYYQPNNDSNGETPVNKNDFSIIHQNETIHFDAALIGIHGTPGEDGKLQGYFDMMNIPYTGCDAATSALTFNKRYTTAVAGTGGICVAKSMLFFKEDNHATLQQAATMQFPLFVKPNNGGSSIGMSKIKDASELMAAFEKAFKEDTQVLVEEFISGREFTIGVYKKDNEITVLPITEVESENYFFDFEAKYQGKSKETTPALISESVKEQLSNAAKKIYLIFNCKGVVRIDFIYNETNQQPYMLEINSIPGQSEASVIPQQVRATGNNLKDFYSATIQQALASKL